MTRGRAEIPAMSTVQGATMYRIREVDGADDDISDTLGELHQLTFIDAAPVAKFDQTCLYRIEPVAFAGIIPSTHVSNAGYFCRVGVLGMHCGHRLQLRLMRGACASEWVVFDRLRHHQ
jgi:hypothetical protein